MKNSRPALNRGESHIADVESERLGPLVDQGLIRATTDYGDLKMRIVDYQPGTGKRLRP